MTRHLRDAFVIGGLAVLGTSVPALAAGGAPRFEWGQFQDVYAALRMVATLVLVAYAFAGIFATGMRHLGSLVSPKEGQEPSAEGARGMLGASTLAAVVVLVVVGVLWWGVDLLNWALAFMWSVANEAPRA